MPLKHRNFQPPVYGMLQFGDLFTDRQLVALDTFSDLVTDCYKTLDAIAGRTHDDDYALAVATMLAFAVDKMTDTNTSLCTWQNKPPRLRATFGRQALPMSWDFAEANIFGDAAGDFQRCVGSLCEVLDVLRCLQFDGHSNCLILSVIIEQMRSMSCRERRAVESVVSTVMN